MSRASHRNPTAPLRCSTNPVKSVFSNKKFSSQGATLLSNGSGKAVKWNQEWFSQENPGKRSVLCGTIVYNSFKMTHLARQSLHYRVLFTATTHCDQYFSFKHVRINCICRVYLPLNRRLRWKGIKPNMIEDGINHFVFL